MIRFETSLTVTRPQEDVFDYVAGPTPFVYHYTFEPTSTGTRTNALSHSSSNEIRQKRSSMVRFLAAYDEPDDPEAFDRHYREVHIPLAKKLPGLRRYTISRNPAPTRDREAYYLVAELDWDNMTDLRHAFQTPEGRATGDDVANLAPEDKVRTMVYELEDALQ